MSRFFSAKYSSLEAYVPGEQPKDMKYIKLNTNESPYPPTPAVVEAAKAEAERKAAEAKAEAARKAAEAREAAARKAEEERKAAIVAKEAQIRDSDALIAQLSAAPRSRYWCDEVAAAEKKIKALPGVIRVRVFQ